MAAAAILIIIEPRDHCAVVTGTRILPRDRRACGAFVQGIHLSRISAALFFLIERCADAFAEQPAQDGTSHGADGGASAFLGARAQRVGAAGTGDER